MGEEEKNANCRVMGYGPDKHAVFYLGLHAYIIIIRKLSQTWQQQNFVICCDLQPSLSIIPDKIIVEQFYIRS